MAHEFGIVYSGPLEGEAEGHTIEVFALVDPDQGVGQLFLSVSNNEGRVADAIVKFEITNPIITSSLTTAISGFAACVATGLSGLGATLIHQVYQDSKSDSPNLSRKERCKDVINRLRQQGNTLGPGASGIVMSCLLTSP
jgi:hypothetical protein